MLVNNLSADIKRNLLVICVVTLLLALPSCRFINHQINYRKLSPEEAIEWAKQDSIRVADSLKKSLSKNLPEGDTATRYYIIIGSFSDHVNAEKAALLYSGQGYNTTFIKDTKKDGGRLELVSVKTFSDLNKAAIFLRDFKAKYDPGAWIYTRKQD